MPPKEKKTLNPNKRKLLLKRLPLKKHRKKEERSKMKQKKMLKKNKTKSKNFPKPELVEELQLPKLPLLNLIMKMIKMKNPKKSLSLLPEEAEEELLPLLKNLYIKKVQEMKWRKKNKKILKMFLLPLRLQFKRKLLKNLQLVKKKLNNPILKMTLVMNLNRKLNLQEMMMTKKVFPTPVKKEKKEQQKKLPPKEVKILKRPLPKEEKQPLPLLKREQLLLKKEPQLVELKKIVKILY